MEAARSSIWLGRNSLELTSLHVRLKLTDQHCIGSNEYFDRAQTTHQNHCSVHSQCRRWVKSTHYRAAAFLSAPPQQADPTGRLECGAMCQERSSLVRAVRMAEEEAAN